MKKNLTISLLVAISALSMAFGYYQLRKANEYQYKAIEFERLYGEVKANAEEQLELAKNARKDAEHQKTRNEECQKKLAELEHLNRNVSKK